MKQFSDVNLTLTSLFQDLPPRRFIAERYAALEARGNDERGSRRHLLSAERLWMGLPNLEGAARSERGAR
jgi:hypothetical protein